MTTEQKSTKPEATQKLGGSELADLLAVQAGAELWVKTMDRNARGYWENIGGPEKQAIRFAMASVLNELSTCVRTLQAARGELQPDSRSIDACMVRINEVTGYYKAFRAMFDRYS